MAASSTITHLVVPGTFDPVTYGHIEVISRALKICPRVTVGVALSRGKHGNGTMFTLQERIDLVKQALEEANVTEGVDVKPLTGLLVDFCHEVGAGGVVKGLRAITDFEYELQQASLNSRLAPDIESIFVMSSPEYGYVSSSIVRELASFGSDVDLLVPPSVSCALKEHFAQAR